MKTIIMLVLSCLFVFPVSASPYQLAKYDVLDISLTNTGEINYSNLTIGPDGYIQIPLVGNIKVAGLTVDECSELLTNRFLEFLVEPHARVMVKSYSPRSIYVFGEVAKPGLCTLTPDKMNTIAALASAGGLTKKANPKEIAVVKLTNDKPVITKYNFKDVTGGRNFSNIVLTDGDMLFIPKAHKLTYEDDIFSILNSVIWYHSVLN